MKKESIKNCNHKWVKIDKYSTDCLNYILVQYIFNCELCLEIKEIEHEVRL